MDVGRLTNGCLVLHMAVDTQEAGLSVFELYYHFVGYVLGAATGFLGAEVVVGSLDLFIRCDSVRLFLSDLTRFPGAGMIDLRATSYRIHLTFSPPLTYWAICQEKLPEPSYIKLSF